MHAGSLAWEEKLPPRAGRARRSVNGRVTARFSSSAEQPVPQDEIGAEIHRLALGAVMRVVMRRRHEHATEKGRGEALRQPGVAPQVEARRHGRARKKSVWVIAQKAEQRNH